MTAKPATAEKTGVTLLRIGVGKEAYTLPEGSTLADLLRAANFDPVNQDLFIDGRPLEESVVLETGAIVSAVPRSTDRSAPGGKWGDVIGSFHGNSEFDAMMQDVQNERENEKNRP